MVLLSNCPRSGQRLVVALVLAVLLATIAINADEIIVPGGPTREQVCGAVASGEAGWWEAFLVWGFFCEPSVLL